MAKILLQTKTSSLIVYEKFLSEAPALPDGSLLHHPPAMMMGKEVRMRRDIGFFSDESKGYRYTGQIMKAQPLTKDMKTMMTKVNDLLKTSFNGVLVNRYRDGTDYIGPHSDAENGLDRKTKAVAGIAFGAVRKFRIRDKRTKKIVLDYEWQPGSLVIMTGNFQKEYTHEIPVQKGKGERTSFTHQD
jgi:alkylated DNA repair dioxygenase AlkB